MMRNVGIVARRELWSSAVSPATWATLGAAWLLTSLGFRSGVLPGSGGELRDATVGVYGTWWWIEFFLAPLLCMRLLSDERRTGTFEALMTAPVSDAEVVLGKFFAALATLAAASLVCPTLLALTVPFGGRPDLGQLFAGYCAALGAGAVLCAIGVFASSLTGSQIFAAFLALVLSSVSISLPGLAAQRFPAEHVFVRALSRASLIEQVAQGAAGVVDLNHVAFHVVASAVFLLFAVRALESRKWR